MHVIKGQFFSSYFTFISIAILAILSCGAHMGSTTTTSPAGKFVSEARLGTSRDPRTKERRHGRTSIR
jgi:hypothetical protein